MEADDDDLTKADLQRRMEEARESITQTVTEIKDTVTTQYQNVRETISQSLDWREQYRRRPVAFSVGALGVGFIVGYSIGGAFGGDSEMPERYYESEGDSDYDMDESHGAHSANAPSLHRQLRGGAYGSSTYTPPSASRQPQASTQRYENSLTPPPCRRAIRGPSYSSGYEARPRRTNRTSPASSTVSKRRPPTTACRPKRRRSATASSRNFQDGAGRRAAALLGKLKDLIGIDLSTQREVAQRSKLEHQRPSARGTGRETQSGARLKETARGSAPARLLEFWRSGRS
jgi:hypothetical protein